MVELSTPDRRVAGSIPVRVNSFIFFFLISESSNFFSHHLVYWFGESLSITMGKKKVKEPIPEVKEKKKNKNLIEEPEEIKKPQRGLAIGDNFGWTGKLPATLLHEHCQKQKWGKVIFDMKKTSKGFIGIANLSWENPKTKEVIHIKMMPDSDTYEPKETTNEARHYAATYALFRINYVKNMKMILPKIFRDYWSDLEMKRLETLKT